MAAMHLAVLDGDVCLALGLLAVCCCHIGVEFLLQMGDGQPALLLPEGPGYHSCSTDSGTAEAGASVMHVQTCDNSHLLQHQQRRLKGRSLAGMRGMQQSLLLSTKHLMSTQRAEQQAFPYSGSPLRPHHHSAAAESGS